MARCTLVLEDHADDPNGAGVMIEGKMEPPLRDGVEPTLAQRLLVAMMDLAVSNADAAWGKSGNTAEEVDTAEFQPIKNEQDPFAGYVQSRGI